MKPDDAPHAMVSELWICSKTLDKSVHDEMQKDLIQYHSQDNDDQNNG
jgi:hypothetical protein